MCSQRLQFLDIFYSAPWLNFRNSERKKKQKKNRKPQKLTLTHQMEHRRVPSSQIYGFSFASTKPTR